MDDLKVKVEVEKGGFAGVAGIIGCAVVAACFCTCIIAVTIGFVRWMLF